MSAIALMAFASCEKQNGGPGDDEIVEDGFYVVGEATGSDNIQADYMMAAGFNEVDKAKRDGMYEKYVALEAGKTFNLAIYEAGEITYFGVVLAACVELAEEQLPVVFLFVFIIVDGDAATVILDFDGTV